MKHFKIFIITGMSGSGKSTAIAAFEDAGFYCVDNMPVALLPKFLELPLHRDATFNGLAFVMDLRERGFLDRYRKILDDLREKGGYDFEILFLEADEAVLLQRYSQTRRHHPLSGDKGLLEGIREERKQLEELKRSADGVIDTTHFNVHDLKAYILDIVQTHKKLAEMRIHLLSFGFKYGVPLDANLIIDVRFIDNPYFIPHLKPLDGTNPAIRDYVMNQPDTRVFLEKYLSLLDFLIPRYEREGKAYLTIAAGCTGGRHRSVVIAQVFHEHLKKSGKRADLAHRDIAQVTG
jgi:UPF0042 nucleotide-binding protein